MFNERIRAFTLPSANISSAVERVKQAIYWKERYEEIETLVKPHGLGVLGETDLKQFKLMQDFAHRVSDVLATIADMLQPRDFDQLEKHWLDDLERVARAGHARSLIELQACWAEADLHRLRPNGR